MKDKRKKIIQKLSLDGDFIKEFNSVSEASKQTGCNKTSIAKVCRGERKSSGGYLWKYR
uniref:NUMOD1 domain-containing DNA-binding protein n=1 Tax=Polaribacter sp. TaxID=1920175 RepID=UPI004047E956